MPFSNTSAGEFADAPGTTLERNMKVKVFHGQNKEYIGTAEIFGHPNHDRFNQHHLVQLTDSVSVYNFQLHDPNRKHLNFVEQGGSQPTVSFEEAHDYMIRVKLSHIQILPPPTADVPSSESKLMEVELLENNKETVEEEEEEELEELPEPEPLAEPPNHEKDIIIRSNKRKGRRSVSIVPLVNPDSQIVPLRQFTRLNFSNLDINRQGVLNLGRATRSGRQPKATKAALEGDRWALFKK